MHLLRDCYVQCIVLGMEVDFERNRKENLHPHVACMPEGSRPTLSELGQYPDAQKVLSAKEGGAGWG